MLDDAGNATHRSGFEALGVPAVEGAAVLASRARCHWITPGAAGPDPDHGSGRHGEARDAAVVTTVSIVRGAWEVRCVYVDPSDAPGWSDVAALRIGGWPVSAGEPPSAGIGVRPGIASAIGGGHTSTVVGVVGFADGSATSATAGVHRVEGATPLGEWTATPWLQTPPRAGTWTIAALALNGGRVTPRAVLTGSEHASTVAITWPDGVITSAPLPDLHLMSA